MPRNISTDPRYKITYDGRQFVLSTRWGRCLSWHSTAHECRAAARELFGENPKAPLDLPMSVEGPEVSESDLIPGGIAIEFAIGDEAESFHLGREEAERLLIDLGIVLQAMDYSHTKAGM